MRKNETITYYFYDEQTEPYEYETSCYRYLKSLSKETLIDTLDYANDYEYEKELEELNKEELIGLAQNEIELFDDNSIYDYYYDMAQREYRETK